MIKEETHEDDTEANITKEDKWLLNSVWSGDVVNDFISKCTSER